MAQKRTNQLGSGGSGPGVQSYKRAHGQAFQRLAKAETAAKSHKSKAAKAAKGKAAAAEKIARNAGKWPGAGRSR